MKTMKKREHHSTSGEKELRDHYDFDFRASVFVSATWQSKGTAPAEWLSISDRADT